MFQLSLISPRDVSKPGSLGVCNLEVEAVHLYRNELPGHYSAASASDLISTTVVALSLPPAFDILQFLEYDGITQNSSLSSRVTVVRRRRRPGDEFLGTADGATLAVFNFLDTGRADAFYRRNHGRWLVSSGSGEGGSGGGSSSNSIRSDGFIGDMCLKLVFVSRVEEVSTSLSSSTTGGRAASALEEAADCGGAASPTASALEGKQAAAEGECVVELPSCAVCLDRLDPSVAGVGPGVCSHQTCMMADPASMRMNSNRGGEGGGGGAGAAACSGSDLGAASSSAIALSAGGPKEGSPTTLSFSSSSSSGFGGSSSGSRSCDCWWGVDRSLCRVCTAVEHFQSQVEVGAAAATAPQAVVKCEVCGVRDRLWTCLVCGFVGCGRYTSEHSLKHSTASNHRWALDLATRRIWDYWEDTYAHRLPGTTTTTSAGSIPGHLCHQRSPPSSSYSSSSLSSLSAAGASSLPPPQAPPFEYHPSGGGFRLSEQGGCGQGGGGGGKLLTMMGAAADDVGDGGHRRKGGGANRSGFGLKQTQGHGAGASAVSEEGQEGGERGERWGGGGGGAADGTGGSGCRGGGAAPDLTALKLHGLAAEYELLLVSQLGEQRRYFERILAKEAAAGAAGAEAVATEEERVVVTSLRASLASLEAQLVAAGDEAQRDEASAREGRKQQARLLSRQRECEARVNGIRSEAASEQVACEEQVRDLQASLNELSFYQRTQEEVSLSPNKEEIRAGHVSLVGNDGGGGGGGGQQQQQEGNISSPAAGGMGGGNGSSGRNSRRLGGRF